MLMRGTRRCHLLHELVVPLHPSRGGRHLRTHLSHSPHRHHRRERVGRRGSRGSRRLRVLRRVVRPLLRRPHRRGSLRVLLLHLPGVPSKLRTRRGSRRLRKPSRRDGRTRERGDRRSRRLLALVQPLLGPSVWSAKPRGHGHRRGVEPGESGHPRGERHGETPGHARGNLGGNLGSLDGFGGSLGDDVEEGAAALALVEVVLADEVLLRVRRNLRGGPGLHEVAGDAAPVTLAELLKAE
mmetsp:Transcript_10140/g.46425  ORF Transcript_10140/g.46425 Transcript_10140/m.46425 type:complete len:240 (+) Transcript_10140:704-1423(+)